MPPFISASATTPRCSRPTPGHEIVASVDMLVAGRHFLPDADPERLGHKTLAVNLSDMAAMGARPRWALLAGALPAADRGLARRVRARLLRVSPTRTASTSSAATPRAVRSTCASRSSARCRPDRRCCAAAHASATTSTSRARWATRRSRSRCWPDARASRATCAPRCRNAWTGRSRALRSGSRCAASRMPRSTSPMVSSAILATSSSARTSAHASSSRACRARPPSTPSCTRRSARSRCAACSPVATTTSCASPQRSGSARASTQIGAALGVALTRIGAIEPGGALAIDDEGGQPLAALPRSFDHFATP